LGSALFDAGNDRRRGPLIKCGALALGALNPLEPLPIFQRRRAALTHAEGAHGQYPIVGRGWSFVCRRSIGSIHRLTATIADAMLEASERAEQLLDEGDMAGAETWHRILNAIERLQAKAPAEGERVH
jgi:hypothetical protein